VGRFWPKKFFEKVNLGNLPLADHYFLWGGWSLSKPPWQAVFITRLIREWMGSYANRKLFFTKISVDSRMNYFTSPRVSSRAPCRFRIDLGDAHQTRL
jgi:hypothetical protein